MIITIKSFFGRSILYFQLNNFLLFFQKKIVENYKKMSEITKTKREYADLLRNNNKLMRENNEKEKAIKKQGADC